MYHVEYKTDEITGWQEFVRVPSLDLALQAATLLLGRGWQVRIVRV